MTKKTMEKKNDDVHCADRRRALIARTYTQTLALLQHTMWAHSSSLCIPVMLDIECLLSVQRNCRERHTQRCDQITWTLVARTARQTHQHIQSLLTSISVLVFVISFEKKKNKKKTHTFIGAFKRTLLSALSLVCFSLQSLIGYVLLLRMCPKLHLYRIQPGAQIPSNTLTANRQKERWKPTEERKKNQQQILCTIFTRRLISASNDRNEQKIATL